jgi:hypothetical protein
MKLKNTFQRRETKYLLTYQQYEELRDKMTPFMAEDQYGLHTIQSLYCDTRDFSLIRQSIEKPIYKEKFRLRSYGTPTADSVAFLEIKKKVKKVVYKRRLAIPYQMAKHYLEYPQKIPCKTIQEQQLMNEIQYLYAGKNLEPKVLIAYDRRAFFSQKPELEDFRITFDFNIRYRDKDLDLALGDLGERIAPEIDVLMEVKALGAYPLWFSHLLANLKIYKGSFSKYAQIYQRVLWPKQAMNVKLGGKKYVV